MNPTRPSSTVSARPALRWIGAMALAVCGLGVGMIASSSIGSAQGFQWPWDDQPRKPVQQPAPAWRPPPEPNAPPVYQPPPIAGASQKAPICLDLERRLVQEGQNGSQSRDLIPMVETQLRQVDQQYRTAARDLDRASCYEYFLFQKTLRRTPKCLNLVRQAEDLKRQMNDLETQRQQLSSSAGRSYQDEIIRELARNNCGAGYSQQAARRDNFNPFSSLWQEESPGTGGYGNSYSALPYATYRTVCVRLCDGYYFPISFSTLPNHFERDAEACSSKCAAPAELFYYQNPGGAVEQMVGAQTNIPYAQLKTAFRYRKEYVNGCSCKPTEYMAGGVQGQQGSGQPAPTETATTPGPRAQATEPATSGWSSEVTPTPQ